MTALVELHDVAAFAGAVFALFLDVGRRGPLGLETLFLAHVRPLTLALILLGDGVDLHQDVQLEVRTLHLSRSRPSA